MTEKPDSSTVAINQVANFFSSGLKQFAELTGSPTIAALVDVSDEKVKSTVKETVNATADNLKQASEVVQQKATDLGFTPKRAMDEKKKLKRAFAPAAQRHLVRYFLVGDGGAFGIRGLALTCVIVGASVSAFRLWHKAQNVKHRVPHDRAGPDEQRFRSFFHRLLGRGVHGASGGCSPQSKKKTPASANNDDDDGGFVVVHNDGAAASAAKGAAASNKQQQSPPSLWQRLVAFLQRCAITDPTKLTDGDRRKWLDYHGRSALRYGVMAVAAAVLVRALSKEEHNEALRASAGGNNSLKDAASGFASAAVGLFSAAWSSAKTLAGRGATPDAFALAAARAFSVQSFVLFAAHVGPSLFLSYPTAAADAPPAVAAAANGTHLFALAADAVFSALWTVLPTRLPPLLKLLAVEHHLGTANALHTDPSSTFYSYDSAPRYLLLALSFPKHVGALVETCYSSSGSVYFWTTTVMTLHRLVSVAVLQAHSQAFALPACPTKMCVAGVPSMDLVENINAIWSVTFLLRGLLFSYSNFVANEARKRAILSPTYSVFGLNAISAGALFALAELVAFGGYHVFRAQQTKKKQPDTTASSAGDKKKKGTKK